MDEKPKRRGRPQNTQVRSLFCDFLDRVFLSFALKWVGLFL